MKNSARQYLVNLVHLVKKRFAAIRWLQQATIVVCQSMFAIAIGVCLSGCGEPDVIGTDPNFATKLVIEGYLYPGTRPSGIVITRNFPLRDAEAFNVFDLLVVDANARILDLGDGGVFPLVYNPEFVSYEYPGRDFVIEAGKSYRLEVEATIAGRRLTTAATTIVPKSGFAIQRDSSNLGPLKYRPTGSDGAVLRFKIAFTRSSGTDFYPLSITALDASDKTFIYGNPYHDNDSSEVNFYLRDLSRHLQWAQNQPLDAAQEPVITKMEVRWFGLPFYGRYQAVLYAADENFKDFFLTHSTVQDFDGNFHEPILHLEGDGIGVFGSAIADTVILEVARD